MFDGTGMPARTATRSAHVMENELAAAEVVLLQLPSSRLRVARVPEHKAVDATSQRPLRPCPLRRQAACATPLLQPCPSPRSARLLEHTCMGVRTCVWT